MPMTTLVRVGWCCSTALAVFVTWLALKQSASAGIGFLYVVPIALTTWWLGRRAGAVAVVACLGLYLLGVSLRDVPDVGLATLVRAGVFVGVWLLVGALRQQGAQLHESVDELRALRAALTPPALPETPGVDAGAVFVPSEHGVSGDFYLLTNAPDGSAVAVVGDVVGHGAGSAQLATFVRASLASFAAHTSDPAQILMLANRALGEYDQPDAGFVTAVCITIRPSDRRLSWAVAGHPRPLRLPGLEEIPAISNGLPLGVQPELELDTGHATLTPDEGVLVYTDGVTEARRGDVPLGEHGLRRLLEPLVGLPARELVAQAHRAVLDFSGHRLRDDLCILALRIEEPAPAH